MPAGWKKRLVWLWIAVPLVAAAELVALALIPREGPSEEEWRAAAKTIAAEKGRHDLVAIAPDWATQGRIYLGALIPFRDFGRFDTTPYDRIFEVSVDGARAPETGGLAAERTTEHGRIAVSRFRLPPRAEILYDFVANAAKATFSKTRRISPQLVVDHWFFPRLVIPMTLSRTGASLTFDDVPLDGVIRGFGIVGYRSGRFNQGGPISLAVYVNDRKVGAHEVRNFGPRTPFAFRSGATGKGTVRFEVRARDKLDREFGFAADVRRATP